MLRHSKLGHEDGLERLVVEEREGLLSAPPIKAASDPLRTVSRNLGTKIACDCYNPGDNHCNPRRLPLIPSNLDRAYSFTVAMSRFFAASDSSSEESSEEELYSNDEASDKEGSDKDSDAEDTDDDSDSDSSGSGAGANRFLKDADSESESEDEDANKVLKSAKDKRFDELEATIRQIENAQKINDWAVISERMSTSDNPATRLRESGGVYGNIANMCNA